jgi:hypothetical protein
MKMEQTKCSETSAYKIQRPGNYPEENIQYYVVARSDLKNVRVSFWQGGQTVRCPPPLAVQTLLSMLDKIMAVSTATLIRIANRRVSLCFRS